jgi:sulfate adenylyltransferase subunit 1
VTAILAAPGEIWDVETQRWAAADSTLTLNDIGHVKLHLSQPVAVDDYAAGRGIGAFLVIDPDSGETLAAGMVGDPLKATVVSL